MNLTATISTYRHNKGEGDDSSKPISLNNLEGDIVFLHSDIKDTRYLTKRIKGSNTQNIQQYISPYLHYLIDPEIKSDYFNKWNHPTKDDDAISDNIQSFLNLKNKSPEQGVIASPCNMARRVAKVILAQIDFATITDSSNRTNFINGTYEPVLMAFLYYFMNDFKPIGENFVNNIGGSIQYKENFKLLIYQYYDEIEVKFKFRNYEGQVDLNALREQLD